MARPLRIEFPGAIYHVMSRGNGKQDIVYDDSDRQRLIDGLEQTVDRYGWDVFSFILMTNHLHAFLRTPQPNVSRGMQYWLSGYANWWCKRHRHTGHVFQGRFRSDLVEDESYFWTVSRYIHLNPVRAGMVDHPADWPWSSYPGYTDRRRAWPWIGYEDVWRAWQGRAGGSDARRAYRRYVEQGVENPPASPFANALQGWILGSQQFADQLRRRLSGRDESAEVPRVRALRSLDLALVWRVVAEHYGIEEGALRARGRHTEMRAVAAWLAKRYTQATLHELVEPLGLGRPQSVGNLTRRIDRALTSSRKLRQEVEEIEQQLKQRQERLERLPPRPKKKKK